MALNHKALLAEIVANGYQITPYYRGKLASLNGATRNAVPAELQPAQAKEWLEGYDDVEEEAPAVVEIPEDFLRPNGEYRIHFSSTLDGSGYGDMSSDGWRTATDHILGNSVAQIFLALTKLPCIQSASISESRGNEVVTFSRENGLRLRPTRRRT